MPFKITAMAVRLRDEPRNDSPNTAGLIQINDVVEKLADANVAGWWKVRVVTPGAIPREGYIRSEFLVEVEPDPVPEEIDKEAFFLQLGYAARTFGANRDFLYAVALLESGVKNIKSKSSSAFGPFQFMPSTWKDLVARHGTDAHVSESDITDPSRQVLFAAIYSHAAQQALTAKLGRVPTAAELYMAHLLGTAGASAVLVAATTQSIDTALRVFYKAISSDAATVDNILGANRGLLMDSQRVCTTDEVLDRIAKKLEQGLEEAAVLGKKLGPPVSETPGNQGDSPWLAVALSELAKNIIEDKTPGGSNPEIEKYFAATTYQGTVSDDVAWCAAFLSWCMAQSQDSTVVSRNKKSAWVPDWLNWGYDIGRPARGAVAIVSPLLDGAAGHIGIVTGDTDKTIVLLAGNQRNGMGQEAVCEVQFSKLAAVSYRWLDWK